MSKGRLRRALDKWADTDDNEARELRVTYEGSDVMSCGSAPDRAVVKLRGTLKTVTLRPRGGVPALEAELYDGSGIITVIWLGRRRIAGISPGRSLQVQGRIGQQEGQRVLYNPRYELIP